MSKTFMCWILFWLFLKQTKMSAADTATTKQPQMNFAVLQGSWIASEEAWSNNGKAQV